jgi:putative chitinase
MIDRRYFYARVRHLLFNGKLTAEQVSGMEAILNEWERRKLTDLRWLAYMLATTKWETAHTMQPIAEYGKGKGRKYGVPDPETGQTYYGRGYVQLTWRRNYEEMQRLLQEAGIDVDLVNDPDLAMRPDVAAFILFEGMIRGSFTGKKLADYFNAELGDGVEARRIINGTDKADDISLIGLGFLAALNGAW